MILCIVCMLVAWLVQMPLYASLLLTAAGAASFMLEWYFIISKMEKRPDIAERDR